MPAAKKNSIPAVEKALHILRLLSESSEGINSKVISATTDTSQSTCYRILKTLESDGWIFQDDKGGFHIGYGLLSVAGFVNSSRRVVQSAQSVLDGLARKLAVTVKLCAPQGDSQITVAAAIPSAPISLLSPVGIPYPIIEAASGAALISDYSDTKLQRMIARLCSSSLKLTAPLDVRERVEQVRAKGWCQNIGRDPRGIDAIACPLVIREMRFALSMIGLRGDFEGRRLRVLLKELLAAKSLIEDTERGREKREEGEMDRSCGGRKFEK